MLNSLPSSFRKDDDASSDLALASTTSLNSTDGSSCSPVYTESINWLPLALLMAYIFFFNIGYGAMIWITVAEILPMQVRIVANLFCKR